VRAGVWGRGPWRGKVRAPHAFDKPAAASGASAQRLGLVTHEQMINALVRAVEQPARGTRIVEVPDMRATGALALQAS
jgi:hypothetical protein